MKLKLWPKRIAKGLAALLLLVLLLAGLWALIYRDAAAYLLQSAKGQAQLLSTGRPISEMLADDTISAELKNKLLLVQEVKAYAEKELKLKPTSNYKSYVDLERDYLVMVLTASPPLKMESKTWWFPIVGTVPYMGYFDKAMGESDQKKLEAEGFETNFRSSPAYSTLGWFTDPLLNTMLQYGDYYLVNTVIHESVHATHWIPGEVTFNENMANFIGNKGALKFYAHKYGRGSDKFKAAEQSLSDQEIFTAYLREVAIKLKEVYDSDLFEANKKEKKEQLLAQMKARYAKEIAPQIKSEGYLGFEKKPWNNALLMSYLHYSKDQEKLATIYERLHQDIPRMMEFLQTPNVMDHFQDK